MKNIKIGVIGALGRMGRANIIAVNDKPSTILVSAIEKKDCQDMGEDAGNLCGVGNLNVPITSDMDNGIKLADVMIDFSSPNSTMEALEINKKYCRGFVIGTTGFNEGELNKIKEYSSNFPIVFSPNFSIGVNLLFKLVESASTILNIDMGYDLEIIEAHHRHKKDAPSGTALKLLEIAAKNSKRSEENAIYGRKGFTGERKPEDIGVSVIRAGDIVGEHTVMYSTEGERVEITHKAQSRQAFSKGALMSAEFISDKSNGYYSMLDVLKF